MATLSKNGVVVEFISSWGTTFEGELNGCRGAILVKGPF